MKRFFLTFLAAGCFLTTAYSQSKQSRYTDFADTVLTLREVVVTDGLKKDKYSISRLDLPVKYIPVSTNEISGSFLQMKGIQNIEEAFRFLPGVRVYTTYGGFQQISVRGFDQQVIMVDGVRDERSAIDNSYPFGDISSVESIELLKGPASVLYGNGTVGGIINIVRKAPVAEQSVEARLEYGSWDYVRSGLGLGGNLAGPLHYRAQLNYSNGDGWRHTRDRKFSGYFALGADFTKRDKLDIRAAFNRDRYGTETGLPALMTHDIYNPDGTPYLRKGDMLPGLDRSLRYNNESDFMNNYGYNVSARYTHTFGNNIKLMETASYANDDINYQNTEILTYPTSAAERPGYDRYFINRDQKTYICLDSVQLSSPLRFSHLAQTVNNQLELSGNFRTGSVKHNFSGGYTFVALLRNSYSCNKNQGGMWGPGYLSTVSVRNPQSMGYVDTKFTSVSVMKTYMHSLYLQDLIEITSQIKFLLAGRYDFYRYRSASAVPANGLRKFDSPGKDAYNEVSTSAFTYRAGLVYLPSEHFQVFASIGSFFKADRTFYDGDNNIYLNTDGNEIHPSKGGELFKPESGYQAEIGGKYIINNKLEVGANLFYIKKNHVKGTLRSKNDEIEIGGETITLDKNVIGQFGQMDSRGFDIDMTYTPFPSLAVMAGYAYNHARIRKIKDNIYLQNESLEGQRYPQIPDHTFYAFAQYVVPGGLLRNLGFHISENYMSDILFRNRGASVPSYWMTDLGVTYKMKRYITLAVNINNLFDAVTYTEPSARNSYQLVPNMPRNFRLSVLFKL